MKTSTDQLIQEIGELFGQYKDDQGRIMDFTHRVNEIERKLNGVKALEFDKMSSGFQQAFQYKNPFLSSSVVQNYQYSRYYRWQRKVIQTLEGGNDVYVVAPPGGGKTTPLMAYWFVNLFCRGKDGDFSSLRPADALDINKVNDYAVTTWSNIFFALLNKRYLNGQPVPGVLFITPIRVLAYEQADGFQDIILSLLVFLKSLFFYLSPDDTQDKDTNFNGMIGRFRQSNSTVKHILANVFERDPRRFNVFCLPQISDNKPVQGDSIKAFDSLARDISYDYICVKTGGSSTAGFNTRPESSPIVIATYGSAKNFIDRLVNIVKFIVYDEAHLYQPLNEAGASTNEEMAASDAYKIVQSVASSPKGVQIAFLSGTIHPLSAEAFTNFLNHKYLIHPRLWDY